MRWDIVEVLQKKVYDELVKEEDANCLGSMMYWILQGCLPVGEMVEV